MDKNANNLRNNQGANQTDNADIIAQSLTAEGKNRKRMSTRRTNKLWIWLGVLVLIVILLWWIFSIGLLEDSAGVINGN
ncbi:MAG: hypothetical protein K2H75_02100 [Muribaculaceae bacterium]|nr:hypothetical protein [Muribaculaceae bacterium]MDE6670213.1 hypothetical protein [Muribaculaceae bacterium]